MILAFLFLVTLSSAQQYICPSGEDEQEIFVYRIPAHKCSCSIETAGTLRYHDNKVQFCNGEEYVEMGVSPSGQSPTTIPPPSTIGSQGNPAKSCQQIISKYRWEVVGHSYIVGVFLDRIG